MSLEFEHIILNKLCNDNEYFNKALPILKSNNFVNIGNQKVFELIKEYYKDYKENAGLTEIIAMVRNIENAEIRETIKQSLISINTVKESKNLDFLCNETLSFVKDSMYLDALRIGSDGLMKNDEDLKKKAKTIMEEMGKVTIDSDLGLDFDDLNTMIEYYQERNIGILSDHKEMNKRLGSGWLPGTLSLIMAASGIGKSLLMTDLISGFVKRDKNTLLVTLEMGDKEVMKRVHANAMDLPINSLIDLGKNQEEMDEIKADDPTHETVSKERIIEAYQKVKDNGGTGKLFIKDFPSGTFSALQLEGLIESYRMEKGIIFDAVFVDYIGIAKSDLISPNAGLYSYIKSIVEEFRSTAKKLQLPIISASQLNRGATNNDDADNSAVSDSMGSVMTADWIVFLLQNEEMKEKNQIVCKCTKNRLNGRTDTWMMNVDYKKMAFRDMDQQVDQEAYVPQEDTELESGFELITPKQMEENTKFANDEVADIKRRAFEHADDIIDTADDTPPDSIDDLMKGIL